METQETILINKLDEIKCFSFNKKDIMLLLSFYNVAFFICCLALKSYIGVCFLTAFLVSLISLFIITAIDVLEKKQEEESKLHEEEIQLRKKIEHEYQRIYKLKRKHELLKKIGALDTKERKNITSNTDSPINTNLTPDKKVYFSYLNRFGTDGEHQNIPEGQP